MYDLVTFVKQIGLSEWREARVGARAVMEKPSSTTSSKVEGSVGTPTSSRGIPPQWPDGARAA